MKAILTKTEDQIIRLKMNGYQRKEIADRMHRSLDTISVHFRNIYIKTEVQNEIELYNWYCENVFHLNIRKMLQVIFLILILAPSIVNHNNDVLRARRTAKTIRSTRRSNSDYFLLN